MIQINIPNGGEDVLLLEGYFLYLIKMILVSFYCGLLGRNRQITGMPVGVRTYILVGNLALLIQTVGIVCGSDPTRISGQLLTGIGFACSAVIFKKNESIKGITTSITMLLAACIGITIGIGLYFETTASILLISFLLIDPFDIDHYKDKSRKNNKNNFK